MVFGLALTSCHREAEPAGEGEGVAEKKVARSDMKLKWYQTIEEFVADLDEVGWFECFPGKAGEALRNDLLKCRIDPEQYYTIPFDLLGFYIDFELEFTYTDWIGHLVEGNRGILPIRVVEERKLPGFDEVLVTIEIDGERFQGRLREPDKWMDLRVKDFLKSSIETARPGLTLTSLIGEGQEQLLCIMRVDVLQKCEEMGMFPSYDGADRDIEEMMR